MTTLNDEDIRARILAGELVRNGEESQIGPACYELRMGSIYYDLTEGDKRIDATPSGKVLIKPGHLVVLITIEDVLIPINIIARIASKGSLFSVGLSPVNTYADPGFSGNLGIITQNLSEKYIELPIGESIAKIDFSLLSQDSTAPYRGQHGFQTQIWPIKHHMRRSYDEVRNDPRVESEDTEAFKILPAATSNALRAIQRQQQIINFSILASVLINTAILAAVSTKWLDVTVSIVTNIISSVIIGLILWLKRK